MKRSGPLKRKKPMKRISAKRQKEGKRICEEQVAIFDGASFVRSVYEGEVDGCSPHSGSGDTLP